MFAFTERLRDKFVSTIMGDYVDWAGMRNFDGEVGIALAKTNPATLDTGYPGGRNWLPRHWLPDTGYPYGRQWLPRHWLPRHWLPPDLLPLKMYPISRQHFLAGILGAWILLNTQ
ncbi:hypothetical protein DAPPUDRAFT_238483 [Daphnia pulex]|uniref:Uncharacterized protein n=1 Tax=Daphnia pulex TaxID=6669 RepID=E9G6J1_DAPPU|nr:hypothetical protein DAPPUDRAFT_238483 [Daphnia pulex]|eukprot:EFX84944.1 hypothetical protein DAPPUDRAFT_238483 [Daphnia pulex]